MKETDKNFLSQPGHEVEDFGIHYIDPILYPDIAYKVATAVAAGKHEREIPICGTGIGMAISANKVSGI